MVIQERLSEEPVIEIRIEKCTEATSSSSSKNSIEEDNQSEVETVDDECADGFGNIAVKNSADVHFGNNTYYKYRGPVTIKQIVYENDSGKFAIGNGEDNFGFQPETVIHVNEECEIRDNRDVQNVVDKDNDKTKSTKGPHWLNYVHKKRRLLFICLLTTLTILLILTIVLLINKKSKTFLPQWWDELNSSEELKIILRDDWLAESPKNIESLSLPVPNVIILCTSTDSCSNRGKCTELTKYIQRFHMNTLNWSDIAYNFIVGGDGYVYEGRGWYAKGAHSHIWNSKSIGIGFIGNFEDENAPKQQILAAKMLIEKGVKDGYIAQNYKLYAHLQVSSTLSPGKFLYEDMKKWPHWTNRSTVSI